MNIRTGRKSQDRPSNYYAQMILHILYIILDFGHVEESYTFSFLKFSLKPLEKGNIYKMTNDISKLFVCISDICRELLYFKKWKDVLWLINEKGLVSEVHKEPL